MASIFSIFKKGLEKSSVKVGRTISSLFGGVKEWDASSFELLSDTLISYDFGVAAATDIASTLKDEYERGKIKSSEDIYEVASNHVASILKRNMRELNHPADGMPTVILFVGVNGSGKTTTVGKLANLLRSEGKKVVLGSCDTFRAAANEQLTLWSERSGALLVASKKGADPSGVAFDAVKTAVAEKADYLLIDTAGRQHNQKNLMEELAKICRSINKVLPGAPHETWLTVDASIGANALSQAEKFSATANLTGIVLTKLDGSGKGGMAVALQKKFELPCFFAGLGEAPEDLQRFDADMYAKALFEHENVTE